MTSFNGGSNLDMIPDVVVIGGTFRAFSNSSFYQVLQRIEQVLSIFKFQNPIQVSKVLNLFLPFEIELKK